MPEELARRGDLALVRSSTSQHAGLYRVELGQASLDVGGNGAAP